MHIALLSDIHGNLIALEAVLADIQNAGGVDAYWILGDLVALGPDPVGVLERLAALPNVYCIRGNTDRYVVTGDRPPPAPTDVKARPELLPVLVEVAGTFAWTQGAVTAAGWLDWLAALPLEMREQLPDGTRFLGVHASPGTDDGPGIPPDISETDLQARLSGCDADLICVGHTHWPLDWRANNYHLINLGSLSNPLPPDLRASYAILQADAAGYQFHHRRVDYDPQAVITALQRLRHPGADFIIKHLRGEWLPRWGKS
jgi:predicted phosphodiesterase